MSDSEADVGSIVTGLLAAVDRGEAEALGELVALLYPELKRLARFQLAHERPGHTLNTTAVVHEAFLRLSAGHGKWADHKHFLRAAATVMRHLLVDHARKRCADKRGSGQKSATLEDEQFAVDDDSVAVIALDNAVKEIARIDPRLEQIIECRYFAGLSINDTAEALGMTVRTVERDCRRVNGYLAKAMELD